MKGDFVIKFLEAIKDTVIEVGTSVSRVPYKGFRYSHFNKYGYESRKDYIGLKNLGRRGLIKNKGNDRFIFTKRGQAWLGESFVKYSRITNGGKWDKKWRVIIFDIPQELHKERIKFGRRLKSLGFTMLQKSVFVFPYPCDDEVADISKNLKIDSYVDLIIAESIGSREEDLLKTYNL